MHNQMFSNFQGFVSIYETEAKQEEKEDNPPALFVKTFRFSSQLNLKSSFNQWDFDADFRNKAASTFDEIEGRVLEQFNVKSFPPIKHKTLGAHKSSSLVSFHNLQLAQGSDEMFLRVTKNFLDSNQKRSWSPQREEFNGAWKMDHQV